MKAEYITDFAETLGFTLDEVEEIYKIYIQDAEKNTLKLEEYLNKRDWDNLEKTVHALKGASGNVNILDLYEETIKFDKKLKSNITEDAAEHVYNIKKLVEEAKKVIFDTFS